jgi:flavin-dependent thymidylate synthase
MKVTMLDWTGKGMYKRYAAELLIFTKNTRLTMSPNLLDELKDWSDEKVNRELEYMSNTIPSSWEFVNYTFIIEGCTRAFTHQLVRNRHGSYAQQTMRVLDVSGFTYETGPTIRNDAVLSDCYEKHMRATQDCYSELIDDGAAIEDARGVLPTNIHTNIVVSFNLRTIAETLSKRASIRTQGEYRDFLEMLAGEVFAVHPWAKSFIRNRKLDAANKLESLILSEFEGTDKCTDYIKLVDILRS